MTLSTEKGALQMDVSLLKLKSMFRRAAGRKGTLLAQALRKQDARQDAAVVTQPPEPATQPAGEQVRVRERSLTST